MIPLDDLKETLRIRLDDQDSLLVQLEEEAVEYAEGETNRYWGPLEEDYTEWLEGTGEARLWLENAPSEAPATVLERSVPGGTPTTISTLDDNGYLLRGFRLIRKGGSVWTRGHEFEVSYTRGYAPGTEPRIIRKAVRDIVAHWYKHRTPTETGTIVSKVPDHVAKILKAWERPVWP